jgi:hypothetical protein
MPPLAEASLEPVVAGESQGLDLAAVELEEFSIARAALMPLLLVEGSGDLVDAGRRSVVVSLGVGDSGDSVHYLASSEAPRCAVRSHELRIQ